MILFLIWAWRIRALSVKFYEDRAPETDLKRRGWAAAGLLLSVSSTVEGARRRAKQKTPSPLVGERAGVRGPLPA